MNKMLSNSNQSVLAKSQVSRWPLGVLAALSALSLISCGAESTSCATSASTLDDAKTQYAQSCSKELIECDQIEGQWYCASEELSGSAPLVLEIPGLPSQANPEYQISVAELPLPIEPPITPTINPAENPLFIEPEVKVAGGVCVDSDNDGWGWDGVASCLVTEATFSLSNSQNLAASVSVAIPSNNIESPPPETNNCAKLDSGDYHITELVTDVVLTAGQSNAAGNQTDYQPDAYAQDKVNNRFIVWTSNNTWEIANPKTQVWHGNRSYPLSYHGAFNHPGFQIGRAITNADECRVVALIATAAPGKPIDYWLSNEDSHVSYIRQKVTAGLNALPGKYKLDMIWWMQGEGDNDQIVDRYYHKLNDLIALFRSEPWLQHDGFFVANETRNSLYANAAIRQLDTDGNRYTASSRGEHKAGDEFSQISQESNTGVHFSAESLRKIGDLVAAKYLNEYLMELGG